MLNFKEILNNSLYRIKNVNLIVYILVNPYSWTKKPIFKKMPTYKDDWLSCNEDEYRVAWLFLKISFFINHDVDDYFDLI